MEAPIEISYAGVVVGRAQEVRSTEGDSAAFFLAVREPMPVGTVLGLRSGGRETPARVVRAIETADADGSGMQMRLIDADEVAAPEWIPPPAKAKPVPSTPVIASSSETVHAAPDPIPETAPAAPGEAAAAPAAAIAEAEPVSASADPAPAVVAENSSQETAAIPEAVPVLVGSSMTGALENATETLPYGQPASPTDGSTSNRLETGTESSNVETESGASAGAATAEELPPARPVASPSGRRKTKRRK
jgi:hypothetical protein